ncbi:MAG TPA: HAD-IB family phosphatase [Terriglobia bacterium]|nr:HAD-IB family phosphatase [Terriglobia bacterium]
MVSAVIFDLDGTLTRTPSPWRHVHERLGVWENVAHAYLQQWLAGSISYAEFCRRDTALWSGRDLEEIEAYLDEIAINRHVPAVAEALVSRRIPSIVISSGFSYLARKIERDCSWDPLLIYANELEKGPQVRIRVSADLSGPLCKRAHAESALEIVGARAEQTLVVSDAVRDLEQLDHCGFHLHVQKEDDLLRVVEYLD